MWFLYIPSRTFTRNMYRACAYVYIVCVCLIAYVTTCASNILIFQWWKIPFHYRITVTCGFSLSYTPHTHINTYHAVCLLLPLSSYPCDFATTGTISTNPYIRCDGVIVILSFSTNLWSSHKIDRSINQIWASQLSLCCSWKMQRMPESDTIFFFSYQQ